MNPFDFAVMTWVNQFSQHSSAFNRVMMFIPGNELLKGAVVATFIWWAWFKRDKDRPLSREHVVATLVGCLVAIVLGRALALVLPYRARPMSAEELRFILPFGETPTSLGFDGSNSFPSDHAVLFFALSIGLLYVSRKAGLWAIAFSIVVVSFPRVYLGYHFPTDIIAGAVLGVAIAVVANTYLTRTRFVGALVELSDSRPTLFYPGLFLLTLEIAEMFESSRQLASAVARVIRSVIP